jgi:hypothetical protein
MEACQVTIHGDELGFSVELFTHHFKAVDAAGLAVTVHAGEALVMQYLLVCNVKYYTLPRHNRFVGDIKKPADAGFLCAYLC